ncbi:RabGAP/TBC [Coniochaeta hoffmannii]|uniref:RabGAP/TBC n=1 Tax=Coniochaeta hoffmannii TaxID=91930 RepID=A0AA38SCI7_9PEZI|nr:RabGAP/TBC [Coniochaeta hoffmannii]
MKSRDHGHHAGHGPEHRSLSGTDMKHGPAAPPPSDGAFYSGATDGLRLYHHGNDPNYYDAFDGMPPSAVSPPMSPSIPQLPPVPISPISPRWDSLFHGNLPVKSDPTSSVGDRTTSMESNPRTPAGARGQSPAFPGFSSHPFSNDQHAPVPSSPSVPNFSLRETNAGAYYRPLTPSSSTTKSFQTDNSPARDGAAGVENFSRPRKPSIRQGGVELLIPRQRTGTLPESTELAFADHENASPLNTSLQHNGWHRGRGYSTSSARSTNTHASIPHHASSDQLASSSHPASVRRATPSSNMTRPPLAYNEPCTPSTARDPPPWVTAGNDELRSSFRSQLTASTALGTVFTASGTERSSVLTKASSITGSLIIDGYARASVAEEDGLSVEDVMGMYENGFHDDSDEEDSADVDKDGSEDGHHDRLDFGPGQAFDREDDTRERPTAGESGTGGLADQMLEAMSEPLPIPAVPSTPSSEPVIARDSAAMFRNSGLPSSLPKDVGLGLAGNRFSIRTVTADEIDIPSTPQYSPGNTPVQNDLRRSTDQARAEPCAMPNRTESSTPVLGITASRSSSRAATPVSASMLPQEPEEDPSSRDRYGFRKANQYISREQYDKWDASYSEYLARRRKKWVAYLKDSSLMTENPNRFPQRSAKTKRFVRKGIPPDWRGAAWFYYAGGPKILAKHPGVYEDLVRRTGLEPSGAAKAVPGKCDLKPIVVEDIEKDLHRTFPDNVRFKPPRTTNLRQQTGSPVGTEDSQATLTDSPEGTAETRTDAEPEVISSLRRVLHAFALYNPRIGYCQSLNFLAGLLLLFVESEEHAFWLLNVITRVYLPGTHETSLEGSKVDLGVLMAALKDTLPSVWKQIGGDDSEMASPGPKRAKTKRFRDLSNPGGKNTPTNPNQLPAITLCMTAWFMSCFIGTLPIETVLRVWDIFFYEGSRTLFRIALTIFKTGETEIKAVADPMEMFGVVQSLPRRMLDCNALLEACYKKRNNFKHLSQDLVEEKRQERREAIQKWKAAQEADTGAPPASGTKDDLGRRAAAGLDLAANMTDMEAIEVRRKGTLFGGRRRDKEREKARAEDVL